MKSFVRSGRFARLSLHAAFLLGALSQAALVHAQTPPFDVATAVSTEVEAVERAFEITAQGQYRLTLTDLGALLTVPGPAPLTSGNVLITRGTTVVASVSTTAEPGAVDNAVFDATPGSYKVHLVGKPGTAPGSGPVSVRVAQVGTTVQVLDMGAALSPPQRLQPGVATYQTEIDVPAAGDYELSVTDLVFPRAIETAGAFLVREGGSTRDACASIPAVPMVCPSTSTVTLEAARYTLIVAGAIPTSSDAGVFNVKLRGVGGGAIVHNRSVELGQVRRLSAADFQLDAGNHSLRFGDFAFPAALQQGSAIATVEGQTAALANGTTPEAAFSVASNGSRVDVFSYARPGTTENAGSYLVTLGPNGGAALLSSVQAVGAGTTSAFAFTGDVTTAGNYRARLGDFAFPVALGSARLAVVQNGTVLGSTSATTAGPTWSLDVANVAAGKVTVVAVARSGAPGGSASQSGGTFGVELAPAAGGAFVIDATQGVGALISVRKVNIATAGKYDLSVSDLNFPAPFSDLMVVVSRGATKVGTLLVGSATGTSQGAIARLLDIDGTVSGLTLTLIAQPGTTAGAAAYGISFVPAPAPPTVTLTASPAAVASGGSTTLTWTSQNAVSCTASSTPSGTWIGTKVLSGSEAITPITGAITFTLRCTGTTGRATEQTASVTIQAPANNGGGGGGGGGGALGGLFVAMLLAAGAARSAQRLRRDAVSA